MWYEYKPEVLHIQHLITYYIKQCNLFLASFAALRQVMGCATSALFLLEDVSWWRKFVSNKQKYWIPWWGRMVSQIAKFMGPTWDSTGSCWPQMVPMLAPWTLLSDMLPWQWLQGSLDWNPFISSNYCNSFHQGTISRWKLLIYKYSKKLWWSGMYTFTQYILDYLPHYS